MFGEFSSPRPTYIVQRWAKEILKSANKSMGKKIKSQDQLEPMSLILVTWEMLHKKGLAY